MNKSRTTIPRSVLLSSTAGCTVAIAAKVAGATMALSLIAGAMGAVAAYGILSWRRAVERFPRHGLGW